MNASAERLKKTTPFASEAPLATRGRFRRFTHASGDRPLSGYTIKRGIGIGGFGEVYFALSDAGKEVALKRIERNFDVEMRGVTHCLNLKHVNLISLWDIKIDSRGVGWVVMEYVPGSSLRDEVESHSSGMPKEAVTKWFRGVAEGVRYLHDRGIVHRDLKPGNIFRDSDADVIKIGDYGLSKLIGAGGGGSHTETVGTFHYMAPEIGRGSYGKEVDLYAIGVILFEMLTGNVPFDGETSQEIVMKHLTMDPDLNEVPHEFHSLIRSLLQKDPQRRCRDASSMLERFELALRGETPRIEQQPTPKAQSARELVYISDEVLVIPDGAEMVFGEVVEVVTAESVDAHEKIGEPHERSSVELSQVLAAQHSPTPQPEASSEATGNPPREVAANGSPAQGSPAQGSPTEDSSAKSVCFEGQLVIDASGAALNAGASIAAAAIADPWSGPSPQDSTSRVVSKSPIQELPPVDEAYLEELSAGPQAKTRVWEATISLFVAGLVLWFAPHEVRWLAIPILMIPLGFQWVRFGQRGVIPRRDSYRGVSRWLQRRQLTGAWQRWCVVVCLSALAAGSLVGMPQAQSPGAVEQAVWAWAVIWLMGIATLTQLTRSSRWPLRAESWVRLGATGIVGAIWGVAAGGLAEAMGLLGWLYPANSTLSNELGAGEVEPQLASLILLAACSLLFVEPRVRRWLRRASPTLGHALIVALLYGFAIDLLLSLPWGTGAITLGFMELLPVSPTAAPAQPRPLAADVSANQPLPQAFGA